MNIQLLAPLLITTLVAISGWYVAHRLSIKRDQENKRRELRVQYLIEAYRRLEYASNRPLSEQVAPDFEKAVADIQLFGTPRQVELAQAFAHGFAEAGTYTLDPLMNELRNDLRKELKLESVKSDITYLRMTFDKKTGRPQQ
jgi:hypothetical protein